MRSRLAVIALAIVTVAIAFAVSRDEAGESTPRATSTPRQPAPAGAVRLSFAYSPEKERLLAPLIERFNAERHTSGGRPVFVEPTVVASGDAETRIAEGKLEPTLWSPASSFWGRLLNYEADRRLVPDDNPSIVRTPLVIAMWEELAEAYGYPKRKLGYRELGRLATGGWAAVGKPQFGDFKYVHTNPDFSTSGLSAVAASYYAAAGKKEGLTEADVAKARAQVRALERSIVHYGDTTLFIAEEMRKHGLGYASAAAMEEITLLDFNRTAEDGDRLVAIYPEEGTFFSDNPLITMEGDWVTDEQRKAAGAFAGFLADVVTPEVAGREGFRPADEDAAPAGLVSAANGADPKQPSRVLSLPEPKVLAKLKAAWRADRKPANVMVVFDNSGSMAEEDKLDEAKAGLLGFFREAQPHDRIGLIKFSTDITPLVPLGADASQPRAARRGDRDDLPRGRHARARRHRRGRRDGRGRARQGRHQRRGDAHGRPGHAPRSARPTPSCAQLSAQSRKESGQIRVFTIAYGSEPNAKELAELRGGDRRQRVRGEHR